MAMVMGRFQKTEELSSQVLQQLQQLKSVATGVPGNPLV